MNQVPNTNFSNVQMKPLDLCFDMASTFCAHAWTCRCKVHTSVCNSEGWRSVAINKQSMWESSA